MQNKLITLQYKTNITLTSFCSFNKETKSVLLSPFWSGKQIKILVHPISHVLHKKILFKPNAYNNALTRIFVFHGVITSFLWKHCIPQDNFREHTGVWFGGFEAQGKVYAQDISPRQRKIFNYKAENNFFKLYKFPPLKRKINAKWEKNHINICLKTIVIENCINSRIYV